MNDSIFKIRHGSGSYNYLDKVYNRLILNKVSMLDENDLQRWGIYNQIMLDLVENGRTNEFEEIKYRITGGENPNVVILEILTRDHTECYNKHRYIDYLEAYLDEDQFGRFYK